MLWMIKQDIILNDDEDDDDDDDNEWGLYLFIYLLVVKLCVILIPQKL